MVLNPEQPTEPTLGMIESQLVEEPVTATSDSGVNAKSSELVIMNHFLTVEKQCDPMCRNSDNSTPLHYAAQNGHTVVVKFLTLEMHCDSTSENTVNATALHLAAAHGHLDFLFLIETVTQTFQVRMVELLFTMLLSVVIST